MKTYFEINKDSNTVTLINEVNGKKSEKLIALGDFIDSLISAKNSNAFDVIESPIAKEINGVRLIQSKQTSKNSFVYILLKEKSKMPMSCFSRYYVDCGMPHLLFGVKIVNNKLSQLFVVCTKERNITENTEMYIYPFPNVSGREGRVCLGGNTFSTGILQEDNVYQVPNQFFSMANTMDSYRASNNKMGYEFEEFLTKLQMKDFDDNLLIAHEGLTYKDWFSLI